MKLAFKALGFGLTMLAAAQFAAAQGYDPFGFTQEKAQAHHELPEKGNVVDASGQPAVFSGPIIYQVQAAAPRLNRRVSGPVEETLDGVPARPVDSFVYDGVGSTPIDGSFVLDVDPISERGFLQVTWTDEHGDWVYQQLAFYHPHHASGVRFSASFDERDYLLNEGIISNIYMHGDTTAGQPVMPSIFSYLSLWGPALVTLNGEPFENHWGIPSPAWEGHIMVTEGARQPDGTVRTTDGGIYNMMRGKDGVTDPNDLEVHFTWHDGRFPMVPGNFPPIFDFFYHMVFEDVIIEVFQVDLNFPFGDAAAPEPGNLLSLKDGTGSASSASAMLERARHNQASFGNPFGPRAASPRAQRMSAARNARTSGITRNEAAVLYTASAEAAKITRNVTGEVLRSVNGVPAEPVDSLVWDGEQVVRIPGTAELQLVPGGGGRVVAEWSDDHGKWTYSQTVFAAPGRATGVRMGTETAKIEAIEQGISSNVYLNGNTGVDDAMLPTRFALLRAMGPVEITLNGEPFVNTIDGQPWQGEVVLGEGTRRPDGTVRTRRGQIFEPGFSDNGEAERYDLELQISFHSASGISNNLPAEYPFMYSIVFEDVFLQIAQSERARPVGTRSGTLRTR